MKNLKLIILGCLLISAHFSTQAQVKVLGRIIPNSVTDKYPTHIDSLGKGGLMTLATWQERNAIPHERRKAGMLVRVKSASVDSTYTLGLALSNASWTAYSPGGNAVWGNISGTLASQSDLNNALSFKANTIEANTFYDTQTFEGELKVKGALKVVAGALATQTIWPNDGEGGEEDATLYLPRKNGVLAVVSDIPDSTNFARKAGGNTFSGTQTIYNGNTTTTTITDSSIKLGGTANVELGGTSLKWMGHPAGSSTLLPSSTGTSYVSLPAGSGTLALTTDLPDISGKENTSNKATTLASPDDTKYPSVKAVSDALALKANLSGGNTFSGTQEVDGLIKSTDYALQSVEISHNKLRFQYAEYDNEEGQRKTEIYHTASAADTADVSLQLPNTSGTLALVEQILAMATVQTQAVANNDGVYYVTASTARHKIMYVSGAGTSGGYILPPSPQNGDLVEFISTTNDGFSVAEAVFKPTLAGSDLPKPDYAARVVAYRYNGSSWVLAVPSTIEAL